MANEVKWIKISTGVFDDEAFQIIDDLPERDAIQLIWFKLLVLAGKKNNHGLFLYKDTMAFTDEMLASIFHRPINIVRLAMETFEKLHMIETIEGVYSIPKWDDYQSLDSFDKTQEQNRIRQQKYRERQKALIAEKMNEKDSNVTDNVTLRYPSISISNNESTSLSFSKEIKEIIDYLNNKINKRYTYKNKSYNRNITARLKEGFTVDDFKTVIDKKCADWMGKEQEQYLTPDTLFAPSKFEKYLNQTLTKTMSKGEIQLNETKDILADFLSGGEHE